MTGLSFPQAEPGLRLPPTILDAAFSKTISQAPSANCTGATDAAGGPDGLLLVCLAEFEVTEGRPEQALALIDAAFAAFDHCE